MGTEVLGLCLVFFRSKCIQLWQLQRNTFRQNIKVPHTTTHFHKNVHHKYCPAQCSVHLQFVVKWLILYRHTVIVCACTDTHTDIPTCHWAPLLPLCCSVLTLCAFVCVVLVFTAYGVWVKRTVTCLTTSPILLQT